MDIWCCGIRNSILLWVVCLRSVCTLSNILYYYNTLLLYDWSQVGRDTVSPTSIRFWVKLLQCGKSKALFSYC